MLTENRHKPEHEGRRIRFRLPSDTTILPGERVTLDLGVTIFLNPTDVGLLTVEGEEGTEQYDSLMLRDSSVGNYFFVVRK